MTFPGPERSYRLRIAKWTVIHFHKRALSSPQALRLSLERRLRNLNKKIKDLNEEEELPLNEEEAKAEVLENETGERLSDEEAGERLDRFIFSYGEALKKEKELIEDALEEAKKSLRPETVNSGSSATMSCAKCFAVIRK